MGCGGQDQRGDRRDSRHEPAHGREAFRARFREARRGDAHGGGDAPAGRLTARLNARRFFQGLRGMFPITTGRPPTIAPKGMVASPHSLASAAGVDALRAGGSAVDAAIATGAALSVLYPHMTSPRGGPVWLVYDAETRPLRPPNGGGR